MNVHEVLALTTYLSELYEARFPPLGAPMLRLWYESVRHLDADTADQAARRWARRNTFHAPTVEDLLAEAEHIQADQREARRSGSSRAGFFDVLDASAQLQQERSENEGLFGRLMARLGRLRVDAPLTLEQMGQQCQAWGDEHDARQPEVAAWLRDVARKFYLSQQARDIAALPEVPEHHADAQGARE